MQQLEVGFLEEALGGPLGVGRVGDDDVEGILVVIEEFEAVADVDFDLGVGEAAAMSGRYCLDRRMTAWSSRRC